MLAYAVSPFARKTNEAAAAADAVSHATSVANLRSESENFFQGFNAKIENKKVFVPGRAGVALNVGRGLLPVHCSGRPQKA